MSDDETRRTSLFHSLTHSHRTHHHPHSLLTPTGRHSLTHSPTTPMMSKHSPTPLTARSLSHSLIHSHSLQVISQYTTHSHTTNFSHCSPILSLFPLATHSLCCCLTLTHSLPRTLSRTHSQALARLLHPRTQTCKKQHFHVANCCYYDHGPRLDRQGVHRRISYVINGTQVDEILKANKMKN